MPFFDRMTTHNKQTHAWCLCDVTQRSMILHSQFQTEAYCAIERRLKLLSISGFDTVRLWFQTITFNLQYINMH